MNSKKMLLLNCIVFIMIASMVVYGAETANDNRKYANAKVDYLNLVRSYADAMIFPGKAGSKLQHYEAVTRADTLMMSLLNLWAIHNEPDKELSLVYNDQ